MFGRKKENVIDRRLQELQRQMSKLDSDIRSLARKSQTGPRSPRNVIPLSRDTAAFPVPSAENACNSKPEIAGETNDALAQTPGKTFGVDENIATSGGLPLFEPRAQISPGSRDKFADYFMAGHFASLRPMRSERRVLRNKAIIMSIAAIIVLIWILYFLYNH